MVSKRFLYIVALCCSTAITSSCIQAETRGAKDEGNEVLEHLADSHVWDFSLFKLYLPMILYKKASGRLDIFSSKRLWKGHGQTCSYQGFTIVHGKVKSLDGAKVYDFSITKNVASMLLSLLILLFLFLGMSRYYVSRGGRSPRGMWILPFFFINLIRNQIVKSNIDVKDQLRFTPYLLTLFFFIWLNNFMGLLPGGANVTGNISVTFVLALSAFVLTHVYSTSYYWKHILNPSGVPKWILPILVPIEILGIFTKPFTLMLRLFSNMLAGHLVLLYIIYLIFALKSTLVPIISISLGVFILFIKLFVSFFQAYIFVFLLAKYLSIASHK